MLHVRRERFLPEAGTGQQLDMPAQAFFARAPVYPQAKPARGGVRLELPRGSGSRVSRGQGAALKGWAARLRKRVFLSAAVFPGASAA